MAQDASARRLPLFCSWSSCFLGLIARVGVAECPLIAVPRKPAPPLYLAKKQERRQRELASAAERDRQALRAKLGKDEVELLDAVQFVQSNDKPPLAVLNTALGIMGGKWRPTGLLSLGRRVWFKNQQHEFRTDEEFRTWFNAEVLPVAELLLPDQRDGPPLGSCPNCEAWIPLDAAVCIGCEANFGRGSAWRPLASRIT